MFRAGELQGENAAYSSLLSTPSELSRTLSLSLSLPLHRREQTSSSCSKMARTARRAGTGVRHVVRVAAVFTALYLFLWYSDSSPSSSSRSSSYGRGGNDAESRRRGMGPAGEGATEAAHASAGNGPRSSFAVPSVFDGVTTGGRGREHEKVDAQSRHHGERMTASGECHGVSGPQKVDYSDVDVVIVMVAPVCTTRQIVQRLNYHYSFRRIYFIVKSAEYCPFLKSLDDSIICLDENTVLPGVSYAALAAAGEGLKKQGMKEGSNRVGWYLQQYLKLGVAVHIPDLSDYYLVWDADNIATRPIHLFSPASAPGDPDDDGGAVVAATAGGFKKAKSGRRVVRFCGNPVSYKSTGYAKFYKRTTGEILMKPGGYPKDPRGDSYNYVCGYMLMYRPHVAEMLAHFTRHITTNEPELFAGARAEAEAGKKNLQDIAFPWDIHAVANVAALEGYYFSEYDSYGSWVQSRYPDEHEIDLNVRYARNPGYLVVPGGINMKEFAKSPAVKKSGKSVTYPCCLTHKRICSIANGAMQGSGGGNGVGSKAAATTGAGGGGGGEGDSLVHILVWEEHKMRYRSSGQCTDKLPPDLDEVVQQVGHGVKAVGPGS